ncbi:minor structural protein [Streptococcus phage 7T]|nr:minor structural protein [Streptococcus phage 7T]
MTYDRQGVGIGKYRERGALDVAGDIYANNSQIQQYQLTSNNGAPKWEVDNANNLYEPGQYILGPSAPGNPNGQWGFLFHYSYNGKNTDGIKEAIQTFWSNNGQMFFRHHRWSKIIDDWEPWIDYTPKKPSVVKREIQIGWGVRANLVRESNVVTLSLIRNIYNVPPGEYRSLGEKIPYGFRPCVQTHLVTNKNVADFHKECAVWHLEPSGDMFYSNQSMDAEVYTGTVTYITEDEYPSN